MGENMRYCQANGDWAGNEPFCQGEHLVVSSVIF